MSRRLLRGARRLPRTRARRRSRRRSAARARASPGRQQARPRRRGELQGGGRRLRGAERSASGAPSTTASATRACAPAATSRTSPTSRLATSSRRSSGAAIRSASIFGAAAAGPRAATTSRVEVDLTLDEVAHGVTQGGRGRAARHLHALPRQRRRAGHADRHLLRAARAPGQLQSAPRTAFGQLVRSQVCDQCEGEGKIAEQPCDTCAGAGPHAGDARACRSTCRPGSTTGSASASSGRGHAGARGGPSGDLYVLATVLPDPRFERHGRRPRHPGRRALHRRRAGTDRAGRRRSRATRTLELAPGTQPATVVRLRGRGLPSLARPAARRPARHRERDGAAQPQRRAARAAGAVRALGQRRELPGRATSGGLFDRIRHAFRG